MTLALVVPILFRITGIDYYSDILEHARIARDQINQGLWYTYTLWYPLEYLASGGSESLRLMRLSSITLLSFFTLLKVFIIFYSASRYLKSKEVASIIAIAAIVVMPLLDPNNPKDLFLGQISPNQWHNSTTLMSAPFVVLMFLLTIQFLSSMTVKNAIFVSMAIFITAAIKPNYVLAFLPVVGFWILISFFKKQISLKKFFTVLLTIFLPTIILLTYQYLAIFNSTEVRDTHIGIALFAVWKTYSTNIFYSILLSICGPLLVLFSLPRNRRFSANLLLAWSCLIMSTVFFAVLAEINNNGEINGAGNWGWAMITSSGVVFWISMLELAKYWLASPQSKTQVALIGLASLALIFHVCSGIFYLTNVGLNGFQAF